jgi:hypothetical protein
MKYLFLFCSALLVSSLACAATPIVEVSVPGEDGWPMPRFGLAGRLGRTISIEKCAAISGLTCTVRLRPGQVLPARMYSREFDSAGKPLGPERRVIYPRLLPGERGKATLWAGGRALRESSSGASGMGAKR